MTQPSKKYKQTVLGSIPGDWIDSHFENVLNGFSSGQTPYRAIERYYKGTIPWITSGELNYNVILDTIEKITKEAAINTNLKIIPKGTLLIAITGLEAEGTRGSCAITGIESTTNQSCMALYPQKDKITTDYLYQFYLKFGNQLAFQYCQGTKQQSYTARIAKKLPIILPPTLAEQNAIATALSDTDELISSLMQIIEKKKAIKQGVMQELLRPKKGWVVRKLRDVARITMGQSPSSEYYNDDGIGLPLIQGNADIENRRTIIRNFTSVFSKVANMGDTIMSVRAPVGEIAKACFQCCLGRGVCSIQYSNDYLYHYLVYFESSWVKYSSGSTFDSVNSKEVSELEIPFPKTKDEELEISTKLSSIDEELEGLAQKLLKFITLKQGMMRELLTGKTRLI